jgi:hypothetical protein
MRYFFFGIFQVVFLYILRIMDLARSLHTKAFMMSIP